MSHHAASVTPVVVALVLGGDGTYRAQLMVNGTAIGSRALPRSLGFVLMALADHVTVRARVFEAEQHMQQTRWN